MRFAGGSLEVEVDCMQVGWADSLVVDAVAVEREEEVHNLVVGDMESCCAIRDTVPAEADCNLVEVNLQFCQ